MPCHPCRPDVLPWTSKNFPFVGWESVPATAHGNQSVQSCAQPPRWNLAPQFTATSFCSGLTPPQARPQVWGRVKERSILPPLGLQVLKAFWLSEDTGGDCRV